MKRNIQFYKSSLLNMVSEFIDDLNVMVDDNDLKMFKLTWNTLGKQIMPTILDNFNELMSSNETRAMYEMRNIDFVLNSSSSFLRQLKIHEWYNDLDEENQNIIWKYLNTFKHLNDKIQSHS